MRLSAIATPLLAILLFSGVFTALIAVTLADETALLLQGIPLERSLLGFIFMATLGAYNLHWHWSPLENHEKLRKIVLERWPKAHPFLAVVGLSGTALLIPSLGKDLVIILPAFLFTILYTAPKAPYPALHFLRRFSIAKTFYLASVWTYVTTVLPLLHQEQDWNINRYFFIIARFFLIYAICLLFDWRDKESDAAQGIHSMVSGLSRKGMHLIFAGSLSISTLALFAWASRDWPLQDLLTQLTPGILCALLYPRAITSRSEILFYGLIDGSLILPCLFRVFLSF
jgi:hypothetical protein